MIILGIDPGTAIMGYGLIEKNGNKLRALTYGSWRTTAQTSLAGRLLHLYNCLQELLLQNNPAEIAVEELYFNRNTTTALAIGHARGVVLLSAAQRGIPVFEYTPLQVKQAVAGYGKADKKQVQQMVKVLLGLGDGPKT